MEITREIFAELQIWKEKAQRKPLLLRGARQVGKTYIVRLLGKSFRNYIEINLLDNKNLHRIFERGDFDITQMLEELSAYFSTPCIEGETLLFLDEVQACPAAIEALRFFYEKKPNLHVIASGSLLEFALSEIPSFGVGRIENLFMHPLNFREFLRSQNKGGLLEHIQNADAKNPISEVLHQAALEEQKKFLLIGGMPEVAAQYYSDNKLIRASETLENIILGYEDDFAKYAGRVPSNRLREVWRSSALQSGKKFVYKHAYLDANANAVHVALNLITQAGLVHKVFHATSSGIPLGADLDLKRFKTIPLDIAIYQRLVGLRLQDLSLVSPTELIHKGALAEIMVGLELLAYSSPKLRPEIFYWHREAKSSNAELDYVIEVDGRVTPIEVKAATKGAMTSMRLFLSEKKHPLGVRVSAENFSYYDKIACVPLYAVSEIPRIARSYAR